MKVFVTKINKENELDVSAFIYKGKPLIVSLSFWYQLIEPRYLINKEAFRSLWFKYTDSSKEVCYHEEFNPSVLLECFTTWNINKLEAFLEKVWIKYKFIIKLNKHF